MSETEKSADYSLYFSQYCFFCQKVLRVLRKQTHSIKLVDVADRKNHMQLIEGGGKGQVPCLLIENGEQQQWMYESNDILNYIEKHNLAT